jgi:drug/metabolite transporter superfamily protein YnfA
MIPNRIVVALFGIALLAVAAVHLTESPIHWGGVVFPAIGGLFLANLALARRRFGHHRGMCAPQQTDGPSASGS